MIYNDIKETQRPKNYGKGKAIGEPFKLKSSLYTKIILS